MKMERKYEGEIWTKKREKSGNFLSLAPSNELRGKRGRILKKQTAYKQKKRRINFSLN